MAAAIASLAAPVNPSGFIIHRGTNLSHWLSQVSTQIPRDSFITENDFQFLARTGFDHVRLPIDEKEMWLEDGTPNEPAFALLRKAIGWARANNLRVIVDLHVVRSHYFNAANEGRHNTLWTDPAAQARFHDIWRQLSTRLHDEPLDSVAYEILNEPVADDPEDWNKLVAGTLAVIRPLEPDRVIVLGSNRWQIPSTMPQLRVPANDRNIILSFHTYSPLLFTHYRASWTPLKSFQGAVHYPGPIVDAPTYAMLMKEPGDIPNLARNGNENWGPARFLQELKPAIDRARELNLQLYCGEFGCMPTVPRADRLAYYRDIVGVFRANGIAFANWEYKGSFGIFEWHGGMHPFTGAPDVDLLDALLGDNRP